MKAQVHGVIASNILQLSVSVPSVISTRALTLEGQSLVEALHITLLRLDDLGLQIEDAKLPEPPEEIELLSDIYVVDTGPKRACYLVATDEMQLVLRNYTMLCAKELGIDQELVDVERVYHVTISNAGGGDVRSSVGSPWKFKSNVLTAHNDF